MSKSIVSGYIMELKSKGLKDLTINIRIRAIRCVLYYLMRNEYIHSFKISEIKENNTEFELYTDVDFLIADVSSLLSFTS